MCHNPKKKVMSGRLLPLITGPGVFLTPEEHDASLFFNRLNLFKHLKGCGGVRNNHKTHVGVKKTQGPV